MRVSKGGHGIPDDAIDSIELHFDNKVQKYFLNNKEGESSDDGVLLLFQFLLPRYSYKKQTNIICNIMSII